MIDIMRIFGPLFVWFATFSAIYGLQGLVCSEHWAALGLTLSHGRVALVGAWLVAIGIQLGLVALLRMRRVAPATGLAGDVSIWLGWAAVVAIIWSSFPVAVTSTCG